MSTGVAKKYDMMAAVFGLYPSRVSVSPSVPLLRVVQGVVRSEVQREIVGIDSEARGDFAGY